jgi:5-methylcytosine-specific restriction endonuclease McrA
MVEVTPDFKAAPSAGGVGRKKPQANKRTDASPARKAEIHAKKCRECRLCGTTFCVNAHHLIPRSLGGIWTESNIVGLCGSGTTGCHGLVEARNRTACHVLRTTLTDAEYSYLVSKKGEDWLERYYPAVWEAYGMRARQDYPSEAA